MKLLILLTDLFDKYGGIQTFNRCLVKAFNDIVENKDLNITIYVLNDKGNSSLIKNYITSSNITYIPFNKNKFLFSAKSILKGIRSDLVFLGHVHFAPISFLINLFSVKKQTKYLVVHGIEVWKPLSWIQLLGISKINKILSVSNFTIEQMIKFNDVNREKFYIFPNTLDPYFGKIDNNMLFETSKKLPKGKFLLTVSRLYKEENSKDIENIIKTFPRIIKEIKDVFYVIVGDGSDKPRLQQIVMDLNLSNNIIFAGSVPLNELCAYYQLCDLFVLPSQSEGFGIVFLEAMYFNKPCIGAKSGGQTEVVDDGETGFLLDFEDEDNLIRTIISLLSHKELYEKTRNLGKLKYENEFSFEKFKYRLNEILC